MLFSAPGQPMGTPIEVVYTSGSGKSPMQGGKPGIFLTV